MKNSKTRHFLNIKRILTDLDHFEGCFPHAGYPNFMIEIID